MKDSPDLENGFSLPELVIVLLITAILVTFAVPQIMKSGKSLQRQNIARELKVYLERAKSDSVKRHAGTTAEMANVTIESASLFTLHSDLNGDGIVSSNEIRQVNFSNQDNITITGSNLTFPIKISFDFRGEVSALDGNNISISPTFIVCDSKCTAATASEKNSDIVSVSPTGTATIAYGGQTVATPEPPIISKIKTDTYINGAVRVSSSN